MVRAGASGMGVEAMILFGAAKAYIAHLEAEVELLRSVVFKSYRPPQQQKKRELDPPPASLVQLCKMFDTAGPKLLADAQREHARGTSYEVIEQRIRAHVEANSNGGG